MNAELNMSEITMKTQEFDKQTVEIEKGIPDDAEEEAGRPEFMTPLPQIEMVLRATDLLVA